MVYELLTLQETKTKQKCGEYMTNCFVVQSYYISIRPAGLTKIK